jgi:molybdate transport system ATP-binding protein
LGRALLSSPAFLLLDEPLSALDGPRKGEIMALIERVRDELRLPILYVSHDRQEVARLADHVVEMGP